MEEEEAEAKANTVEKFKVGSVPTLMYIPDFITQHHQALLLNTVCKIFFLFFFFLFAREFLCSALLMVQSIFMYFKN